MRNILDLSLEELKIFMIENGESAFRSKQVFDWIYKGVASIDDIKGVSLAVKEKLKKEFYIGIPKVIKKVTSKDKRTTKYLFKLRDNNVIESVLMKYNYGNSVCLSTQVGCNMGCTFCASTIGGKAGDLSSGDILGQIIAMQIDSDDRISNIVLMGSGEPFDNYDNVIKFLELVSSKNSLNIGSRHITLSTCGLTERIRDFADLNIQVNLAISLHAPFDDLRKTMMPIANKYSIKELLETCKYYVEKTNRRITFEYALVDGVNDTAEHARALGKLLSGILCHVNLIPVNDVKEKNYIRSKEESIKNFKKTLEGYNIVATVRKEMGAEIDAACGQLRRDYIKENEV